MLKSAGKPGGNSDGVNRGLSTQMWRLRVTAKGAVSASDRQMAGFSCRRWVLGAAWETNYTGTRSNPTHTNWRLHHTPLLLDLEEAQESVSWSLPSLALTPNQVDQNFESPGRDEAPCPDL